MYCLKLHCWAFNCILKWYTISNTMDLKGKKILAEDITLYKFINWLSWSKAQWEFISLLFSVIKDFNICVKARKKTPTEYSGRLNYFRITSSYNTQQNKTLRLSTHIDIMAMVCEHFDELVKGNHPVWAVFTIQYIGQQLNCRIKISSLRSKTQAFLSKSE